MTMSRKLGIITGSAIAIAILVVAVGIPEFGEDTDKGFAGNPPPAAEAAPPTPAEPEPPAAAAAAQPTPQETADEPPAAPAAVMGPLQPESAPPEPEPELHWHAFWSPFGSQVAANGFVSRLQRVTGLDYRVVRTEPGVFEVAVAYASREELAASLELIAAATGLELPES